MKIKLKFFFFIFFIFFVEVSLVGFSQFYCHQFKCNSLVIFVYALLISIFCKFFFWDHQRWFFSLFFLYYTTKFHLILRRKVNFVMSSWKSWWTSADSSFEIFFFLFSKCWEEFWSLWWWCYEEKEKEKIFCDVNDASAVIKFYMSDEAQKKGIKKNKDMQGGKRQVYEKQERIFPSEFFLL